MTYLLINLGFLAMVALITLAAWLRERSRLPLRAMALALIPLFVLTAVFDNLIILSGIVDYDSAHRSGALIGVAPLEDFAYPLATAFLLPSLWALLTTDVPTEETADAASAAARQGTPRA